MGRRSADCASVLGVVIVLLTVFGLVSPLHQVSFFSKGQAFATINLFAVRLNVEGTGWHFESQLPSSHPLKDWDRDYNAKYQKERAWLISAEFSRSHDIQAFNRRFCARTLRPLWPALCEGFGNASKAGIALVVIGMCGGILVQGLCAYLVYDYSRRKPSRRTRRLAVSAMVVGLCAFVFAQVYYVANVTLALDRVQATAPHIAALLGSSKISGLSSGQLLLWATVLVQALQLGQVLALLKSPYEDSLQAMQQAPLLPEMSKMVYGALDEAQLGKEWRAMVGPSLGNDLRTASVQSAAGPWNSQANIGPPKAMLADGNYGLTPAASAPPPPPEAAHTGLGFGQGVGWFEPPAVRVPIVGGHRAQSAVLGQGGTVLVVHQVSVAGGQAVAPPPRDGSYVDPTPPQELLGQAPPSDETW